MKLVDFAVEIGFAWSFYFVPLEICLLTLSGSIMFWKREDENLMGESVDLCIFDESNTTQLGQR